MPSGVLAASVPTAPFSVAFGVRAGDGSPGVRSDVLPSGVLAPLSVLVPVVVSGDVDDSANAVESPPRVSARVRGGHRQKFCILEHAILTI